MNRLAAPAQQHGIARAKAQRGRIGSHVRAAFVNDPDQPDRHPHPGEDQAIGPLGPVDFLPDRIGQIGHRGHGIGDSGKAAGIKPQPIKHGPAQTASFTGRHVFGIGRKNGGFLGLQRLCRGPQCGFPAIRAKLRELRLRRPASLRQRGHQRIGIAIEGGGWIGHFCGCAYHLGNGSRNQIDSSRESFDSTTTVCRRFAYPGDTC